VRKAKICLLLIILFLASQQAGSAQLGVTYLPTADNKEMNDLVECGAIFNNLCQLYILIGNHEGALEAALKTTALMPNNAHSWALLAQANMKLGKNKECIDAANKALVLAKDPATKKVMQEMLASMKREISSSVVSKNATTAPGAFLDDQTLSGYPRWKKERMPLKVHIAPGKYAGYKEEFSTSVRDAFAEWQSRTEELVTFTFVDAPAGADITCEWVGDGKTRSGLEAGHTGQTADQNGMIHCEIKLQSFVENTGQTVSAKHAALHEIGHALGILSHSKNDKDIMYWHYTSTTELSDGDVATLKALYNTEMKLVESNANRLVKPVLKPAAKPLIRKKPAAKRPR
jgi:predicted Zn-dependent protease